MATLTVTVDGDASGAVGALDQTNAALTNLGSAASSASGGMNAMADGGGRAFTMMERTGSGIRELAREAGTVGPIMAAAGGASGELGTAIGGLGSGVIMATATLNPLVGTLIGISAAAAAVGPVMDALGFGAQKVAPAMSAADLAAKDASLSFGSLPGSVGVSTDSLIALAAAGLRAEGPLGSAGSTGAQAASQIFDLVGASDAAGTATAKLASQSDLLAASQEQMSSRLMASVGSFNAVAEAASRAGMSVSEYQQIIGTQTAVAAPPELWQGRAGGGPVTAGTPYWVGERGRELYIPSASGTILPSGSAVNGPSVVFAPQLSIGTVYATEDLRSLVMSWMRDASLYSAELRGYVGVR